MAFKYQQIREAFPMKAIIIALALLSLPATSVGVTGLPSAIVTDGLGVQIHFDAHIQDSNNEVNMIQASGCKFVREDLMWGQVETTAGQYDFASTGIDALYDACAARGIRILFTLDGSSPSWYSSDPTSASWKQGFTNFAAAAAAHFNGGSNLYEIWNEPDGGGIQGNTNAGTYMAIAKLAVPAMRQADPSCTIVGPAVSYIGSGGRSWLTTCFQQGLLNLVDAVSVHPYQSDAPESVVNDYAKVRSLMQTWGHKTVPLVSSEWGYSTGTTGAFYTPVAPQVQGDYLARTFLVNLSQGIRLSSWYDFKNDGTDSSAYEQNFGTVNANLTVKPAYNELHLLTASLKGTTFSDALNDGNSADWLLEFALPGGQKTLAAWTTGDAHAVTVSAGEPSILRPRRTTWTQRSCLATSTWTAR